MAFDFETTLAERILSLNPSAYYKLDETSGTTAADSSGDGNDGTYNGGVTLDQPPLAWAEGASRSVAFDGVNGYMSLTGIGSLASAPAVTMACVVRIDEVPAVNIAVAVLRAANGHPLFSIGARSDGSFSLLGASSTSDSFTVIIGSTDFVPGRTYALFAIVDYTDKAMALYVDGALVAEATSVAFSQDTAAFAENPTYGNTLMSNQQDQTYNEGALDDVALFPVALTAADAFALAERVVQETYVESVLQHQPPSYYRLAEQAGTDAVDSGEAGQDGIYEGGVALAQPGLSTDAGALAADFDGSSGYVDLGNIGGAFDGRAGLTLIASFRLGALPSTNPVAAMITTHAAGNASTALIAHPDGSLQLFSRSAAGDPGVSVMAAAGTVEAGAVYHVAGSLDFAGDMATLYVNGAQVGSEAAGPGWSSSSYVHSAPPANKPCQISGQVDLARFLGSTMSDVAWVTGALTPAQISALHYRGTVAAQAATEFLIRGTHTLQGQPAAGLIAWALDAATGDKVAEAEADSGTGEYEMTFESADPVFVFFKPPTGYLPEAKGPITPVEDES